MLFLLIIAASSCNHWTPRSYVLRNDWNQAGHTYIRFALSALNALNPWILRRALCDLGYLGKKAISSAETKDAGHVRPWLVSLRRVAHCISWVFAQAAHQTSSSWINGGKYRENEFGRLIEKTFSTFNALISMVHTSDYNIAPRLTNSHNTHVSSFVWQMKYVGRWGANEYVQLELYLSTARLVVQTRAFK